MYIKIHTPKGHSSNKGSSSNLIQYLEKENNDLDVMHQERFFNHDSEKISGLMAERTLDDNKYKLGKNDSKFYMLTVNPSQKELKIIDNDKGKLKDYVRNVMDQYAANFNRVYKNGEKLQGKDLVYYAKIEHNRTYGYDEKKYANELKSNLKTSKDILNIDRQLLNEKLKPKEVKELQKEKKRLEKQYIKNSNGVIIKPGNLKDGDQRHIHIVVHRYDKQQKFKLSPLSNARNTKNQEVGKGKRKKVQAGFDRDKFVENCEKIFDKQFDYQRPTAEQYQDFKKAKKMRKDLEKVKSIQGAAFAISNPTLYAKTLVKQKMLEMIENKTLQKSLGVASNPKQIKQNVYNKVENIAIKKVAEAVVSNAAYAIPAANIVKFVLDAAKNVTKQLSRGMGI